MYHTGLEHFGTPPLYYSITHLFIFGIVIYTEVTPGGWSMTKKGSPSITGAGQARHPAQRREVTVPSKPSTVSPSWKRQG
eukprot:4703751-Heterocapsa_arctica.AAC.1